MDKPLSQERLSEDTRSDEWVDEFEFQYRTHVPMFGYVENSDLAPIIKSHRALSAEVKRLQAIEAELTHRCESYELSKNEAWKLYQIIDQHNSELQQKLKKPKE